MKLEVRGMGSNRGFRAHIVEALEHAVERLGMTPVGAQVGFDDENGPKGGVAVSCLIEIRLPRRPPLDVRHVGPRRRGGGRRLHHRRPGPAAW
jgi:hypothetical protein